MTSSNSVSSSAERVDAHMRPKHVANSVKTLTIHNRPPPYFKVKHAEKKLLVGLVSK